MRFLPLFPASFLLFLSILAFPSSGWTATYTLPADQLPGCSAPSPVVICGGWFSLNNNDVVIITSPTTIRITGGGTLNSAQVNVGGSPANLTIDAAGQQLGMGSGAHLVANVTARTIQSSGSSNVRIEGTIGLTGQFALGSQSQITGNITAGSMGTGQNNTITGDVDIGTGGATLGANSTINGNLAANSLININNSATVTGSLQSSNNVNLSQGATVGGPIQAGGSLNADSPGVSIGGSVDVGGQVTLGNHGVINGSISATGQVSIHDDAVIYGPIETDGQITINEDVVVHGGLTAGTSIQILNGSHIHGNVVNQGMPWHQINIGLDVMIEGNVDASGVVTNAGIIQGNINAKGPVWLNGNGSCSVENDGRLEPLLPGQGGTQACVRGYVNAPNDDQIPPGNVGGIICDENVNEGPCPGSGGSGVSVYRIINPGAVLTCEALNLEVHACADANCLTGQALTGSVTVQAAGAQNFSVNGNFAGSSVAMVNMSISTPGTYTLNVTAAPEVATDPLQCQGPNGCQVTAVDSVLRWSETGFSDIRHQTAGVAFQLEVEAIRTDTETGACAVALQGVTTLDVGLDCLDPGVCSGDGLQFSTLAGDQLAEWPATAGIPVNFDGSGRATLGAMNYEDAGRIRLRASANTGATTIAGWSNDFVVRPASVGVDIINLDENPAQPYPPTILGRAGEDLQVSLSALSATGRVTRNFGMESSPESLMLLPAASTLVPSGGFDGLISTEAAFARVQGGVFEGVVRYSEAGTARFDARVASQNYLLSGGGAVGHADAGRFLPWEFRVEPMGTGLTMACVAPSSTPGFTYLDQSFETQLRVSARNRAGAVTQNYPDVGNGAEAILVARNRVEDPDDGSDIGFELSDRLATALPAPSLPPSVSPPPLRLALHWGATQAGYGTVDQNVLMERPSSVDDWEALDDEDSDQGPGPFEDVVIGVEIDDNEGGPFVPLAGADFSAGSNDCGANGSCTAVTLLEEARFVYGRMALTDTMGSEFSDLPVTLQAQYWDGERFRVHQQDQCTAVDFDNLSILVKPENFDTEPAGLNDATTGNGISPSGSLLLTAPVATDDDPLDNPAEVLFQYEAPDWLQFDGYPDRHPEARAIFGTYGGHDRVIHWKLVR